MNMFKQTKSKTVEEYINSVPEKQKDSFLKIHEYILKNVPELKVYFANNMIGYGSFPYVNYKKENISWPIIALAVQKNYISVYVCSIDGSEYIADKYSKDLGKVSVGKSCIRFKKFEDLNLETLKKVLIFAKDNPGLVKN